MPELVPSDLWGRSAFRMLGKRIVWTKQIRPDALAHAKNRCELCRAGEGRLICHDKWVYDDKKATANLTGFEIHCGSCDSVTHVGRMMQVADPQAVLEAAVIHLRNVNGCTTQTAIKILKEACFLWDKRSKKKWKIKVAKELLERYPDLEGLPQFLPNTEYLIDVTPSDEADVVRFVNSGNPTEVTNAAWIEAKCSRKMKKATERTGKWLLFVAEKYIDNTWQTVKKSIEDGKLWKMAKVSTACGSRGRNYVVCVYTYDHEDIEDVTRIRDYLREIGFKRAISYKTNEQTTAGIYSDTDTGIAKYKF